MIKNFIIIFLLFFSFATTIINAQDSIKISIEDWQYIEESITVLDSSIIDCENLNELYEQQLSEFQSQVFDLKLSNAAADSIILFKSRQLEKRKEQVNLLNTELNKQKMKTWLYSSGGILITITIALLLVNK